MRLKLHRPVEIDFDEALRYLRSKNEPSLLADVSTAAAVLQPLLKPAAAAVCFELERSGGSLFCGDVQLPGESIARHFDGCDRCIALGVTIGFEVDRLIAALGHTDPYRALLTDACASAAIEDAADMATVAARDAFCPESPITFRFSPGYGDLPLSLQPKLLEMIDARRMLGLTVSKSMLLSPIKSVTAFIGLKTDSCEKDNIIRHDCKNCFMNKSCQYKRSSTKG